MSPIFYIVFGFVAVIFIFVIVIVSITIAKGLKNTKIDTKEVNNNQDEEPGNIFRDLGKRIKESVEEFTNPNVTCPYCKSTYSRKESKCPSCGAGKPKK